MHFRLQDLKASIMIDALLLRFKFALEVDDRIALSSSTFNFVFICTEWGKRYLQPIAEWFGLEFPDAITKVIKHVQF